MCRCGDVDGVAGVHELGRVELRFAVASSAWSERKPLSDPEAVGQMPLNINLRHRSGIVARCQ